MTTTVRTRMASGVVLALLLVGCGAPSDDATIVSTAPADATTTEADAPTTDTSEPDTTTTTEDDVTTTTSGSTTTAPGATDVCFAITPDQVAAVLGSPAPGTPVAIAEPGDGCRWTAGGIGLGAAVVSPSALPVERGSAEVFPLFGLVPEDYTTSSVSVSTSADTAVVVAVGYPAGATVDDDALTAISDTLSGR